MRTGATRFYYARCVDCGWEERVADMDEAAHAAAFHDARHHRGRPTAAFGYRVAFLMYTADCSWSDCPSGSDRWHVPVWDEYGNAWAACRKTMPLATIHSGEQVLTAIRKGTRCRRPACYRWAENVKREIRNGRTDATQNEKREREKRERGKEKTGKAVKVHG